MSKYKNTKVTVDGIPFDSKAESLYYKYLKEQKEQGIVKDFELQPVYILQEKFRKNGKAYRQMTYKADFEVEYTNGDVEVVDVKGMLTEAFKIKLKLFEYRYDKTIKLVNYTKKYGWETLEESTKRKKEMKKRERNAS